MVERAAVAAKLRIKAHAHMLRHDCGYKLANDEHDTRALQSISDIGTFSTPRGTLRWRKIG
jgi:site-specific recombinase XerD